MFYITPEPHYIMVRDFVKLLSQNNKISWLHISLDIPPEPQYLKVANILRYFIKIKISHAYRYHEIFHQSQNILWLYVDIKIKISHGYRYHEIFPQDQNISWL